MKRKRERTPIEPDEGIPLIDCHCHFPLEDPPKKMNSSYEDQYQRFFAENGQFIITSAGFKAYPYTKKFLLKHDKIAMTLGWGPQTVTYTPQQEHDRNFQKYLDLVLKNPEDYVAIGEIGLDFHHAKKLSKRERQIDIFERIIQETKHLGKPYSLHVRNAGPHDKDPEHPDDTYNEPDFANNIIMGILDDEGIPFDHVMWHCFSGPSDWGKFLSEKGFYISVPSSAFGFRRWRKNSKNVPVSQLLTETDSAWQHPYRRGGFNTPVNVKYAVAAIAYSHQMDQQRVANQIIKNAKSFFHIDL
jgi:TatD DNase family protein